MIDTTIHTGENLFICITNTYNTTISFDAEPRRSDSYSGIVNWGSDIVPRLFVYANNGTTLLLDLQSFVSLDAIGYSGETFTLDTLFQSVASLLNPVGYGGSSADSSLTRNLLFNSLSHNGELATASLTAYPAILLNPNIYVGETGVCSLIRSTHLSTNYYSGEVSTFSLTVLPSIIISTTEYVGESLIPSLQTSLLLSETISTGETTSIIDLTIHPSIDLGIVNNYSDGLLSCTLVKTQNLSSVNYSGEYSYTNSLEIFPSPSLIITYNAGELTDITLATTVLLSTDNSSGESLVLSTINVYPPAYLETIYASGENTDFILRTTQNLSLECKLGEYLNVNSFNTSPAIEILPNIFTSELVNVDLSATYHLKTDILIGENANTDLDIHSSISLDQVKIYVGENANVNDFVTSQSISWLCVIGENVNADLDTHPSISLSLNEYVGENANSTLSLTYHLSGTAYQGNTSYVTTIAAVYGLSAFAYTGSFASSILTQNLGSGLISDNYHGSYASIGTLNSSTTRLRFDNFSGTTLTNFDLTTNQQTSFASFVSYSGEFCDIALNSQISLPFLSGFGESLVLSFIGTEPNIYLYNGTRLSLDNLSEEEIIKLYNGESFSLHHIDTEPNIYAYIGEKSSASLTITKLTQTVNYSGEYARATLVSTPPIVMSAFAYHGTTGYVTRANSKRYDTLSILIKVENDVILEFNDYTRPDLTIDDSMSLININSSQIFCDLSTSATFLFSDIIESGQANNNELQIEYTFKHKLCYGNFIPDGGNIVTDLLDVLSDDCLTYYVGTGESMEFIMFQHTYVPMVTHAGERAYCYMGPSDPPPICEMILSITEPSTYSNIIGYDNIYERINKILESQPHYYDHIFPNYPTPIVYDNTWDILDYYSEDEIFNFAYRSNAGGGTWDTTGCGGYCGCKAKVYSVGQSVNCGWYSRSWYDCPIVAYDGPEMIVELKVDRAIETDALTLGAYAYCNLTETWRLNLIQGEVFNVTMFEQPEVINAGSTMTFDLVTKVKIEFLEEGCLPNEEPDSKGIALEYTKYSHLIKTRCYYL